jgi:hypothetical protein
LNLNSGIQVIMPENIMADAEEEEQLLQDHPYVRT